MNKKEQIYDAAVRLFSQKSFDAVGIREIATEANVNSAMISYYFGGKNQLLIEIFNEFSTTLLECIKSGTSRATDYDTLNAYTSRELLTTARNNRDLFMIGLKELNSNREGLIEPNKELQTASWTIFYSALQRFGLNPQVKDHKVDLKFTVTMGAIFADYLMGAGRYIDSDEHFLEYQEVVTLILKSGSQAFWE